MHTHMHTCLRLSVADLFKKQSSTDAASDSSRLQQWGTIFTDAAAMMLDTHTGYGGAVPLQGSQTAGVRQ